jgi:hypothetical protein
MAWIFERNLGAWCDAVSVLLGAGLTDKDAQAIRTGVASAKPGSSFRYRLGGPDDVEMTAVLDDPPDVVHVWIEPNSFDAIIEGITMMCRFFTINGSIRRS